MSNDKNYESSDINVSHPSHYQSDSGLEAIDVIEAFTANLSGIEAVDTAQIIKYVLRWKKKNGVQDLEKAMWYLQHLINHTKGVSNMAKTTCRHPEFTINRQHDSYRITAENITPDIADQILDKMHEIIADYELLTVKDILDLLDLSNIIEDGDKLMGWDNKCAIPNHWIYKGKNIWRLHLPLPKILNY